MVKKRRDGGIMVWSPRGARAGRRECNTAFYWLIRRLIFGDLPLRGFLFPYSTLTARAHCVVPTCPARPLQKPRGTHALCSETLTADAIRVGRSPSPDRVQTLKRRAESLASLLIVLRNGADGPYHDTAAANADAGGGAAWRHARPNLHHTGARRLGSDGGVPAWCNGG